MPNAVTLIHYYKCLLCNHNYYVVKCCKPRLGHKQMRMNGIDYYYQLSIFKMIDYPDIKKNINKLDKELLCG